MAKRTQENLRGDRRQGNPSGAEKASDRRKEAPKVGLKKRLIPMTSTLLIEFAASISLTF